MNTLLTQVQSYIYTNPNGLRLEVLFAVDSKNKGYINATAIAKHFGKEPHNWFRHQHVQEYINALIESINSRSNAYQSNTKSVSYQDLVIMVPGDHPEHQETWLHPKLADIFARWLSPHFAVWCDATIADLLGQSSTQQQFSDLQPILNQFLKQIEQRLEENLNTTTQMLNRFQVLLAQDSKPALEPIHQDSNQVINLPPNQQQQIDLLQPAPTESTIMKITDFQAQGLSWSRIAEELNAQSVVTITGKGKWYGSSVKRYAAKFVVKKSKKT